VFDGLTRAFDTALALRESGLDFVLAPTITTSGEISRRIDPRYAIAVFPFLDGRAGEFGRYTPAERTGVYEMLADLHRATPTVASSAMRIGVELPGRRYLEDGLRELNQTWVGGPFAEPARRALATHASEVVDLIALADRLAADVTSCGSDLVITHGEPHAANVLTDGEDHWLIDWDTVALAPPERDLWMLDDEDDDGASAAVYVDATGHQPDRSALAFFRLTWDLKDLASFIQVLRSPHGHDEDTEKAYEGVTICASSRHRWTALLNERDTTG
jgi:spectinomycin phosphotransferase